MRIAELLIILAEGIRIQESGLGQAIRKKGTGAQGIPDP
jgi:hypothetical protein